MGAKFAGDEDDAITDINITPMVDVMLVLLIIFMVTASIINKPSIEVELPEASTGGETEPSPLGITIAEDGTWYLNEVAADEQAVRDFIRQERAAGADLQALIAAHKSVPHGDVVKAIDVVKQEGVLKFAINIEPAALPASAAGALPPPPESTSP